MESFKFAAPEVESDPEVEAELMLEKVLSDPDNAFLIEHEANFLKIENAETCVKALQIAEELIFKRLERTFHFKLMKNIEGVSPESINVEGIKNTIESIKKHKEQIGEGGDAFVVIAKNEIREFPPEVCYKFAKVEKTPRGRNAMPYEAELQEDFYRIVEEISEYNIGVPMPFYSVELGRDKMIAMEKLPAKSVDDILRGMGSLPEWLDIDKFCDQLEGLFTELHAKGLYHRDMHVGNIMIRQTHDEPEDGKWGYLIDFGLSGYGMEGMDPYKKDVAGSVFTYANDNGIVDIVRNSLFEYKSRNKGVV